MKSKKIISLALALIMAVAMFVVAVPSASAVTNEVSLIYATSGRDYANFTLCRTTGYVEVLNIGYAKNVTIHYTFDGVTWQDTAASYLTSTHGNYEAWKFTTEARNIGLRAAYNCTFAIKYEVNGQTYWDNNNGNNYQSIDGYGVSKEMAFGSGALAVDYASIYRYNNVPDSFAGCIQLKNLGYQKVVKVRYTTDNWATYSEIAAEYNYTAPTNGVEYWYFDTPVTLTGDEIEYAVSYTVNGQTYWDNNFGSNYIATL